MRPGLALPPGAHGRLSPGCLASGLNLFQLHRKGKRPRLVPGVQPGRGASTSRAWRREGEWHPGSCLFILYPFNVIVTKIKSLKAQNLENMDETKEETNGNPSPISNFDFSFQSFFCVCTCVCALYPNGAVGYILLGGSVSSSFHTVG